MRNSIGRTSVEHKEVQKMRTSVDFNNTKPIMNRFRNDTDSPGMRPWSSKGSDGRVSPNLRGSHMNSITNVEGTDQVQTLAG